MSDPLTSQTSFDPRAITRDPLAESVADESPSQLVDGMALCLSGGGYRAMLFHVGAILRLNEFGILGQLKRIASVSGGSITSAVLGMNWNSITWKDGIAESASLNEQLVTPIRQMAATSIDVSSVIWGALSPWATINDEVVAAYDRVLFHGRTLQNLPDDSGPRFVFNATNVKTGSLWRFSRPYMADYRIGIVENPSVSLANAVAASSAFPPFLSPMRMSLDGFNFKPNIPPGHNDQTLRSLRGEAVLTDGGVYDNLGLETVWKRYKTVLVSDGGRKMDDDPSPAGDWARHSRRLIDLLQHEVSNLRRRMVVDAFKDETEPHNGTYWGIQTNIADYDLTQTLDCPHDATNKIARIETRLTALSEADQKRIINWGFAVCDAGVRKYLPGYGSKPVANAFVYPDVGVRD